MNNNNIDFVLPWVDGNDPEWIKEFNKWSPAAKKNLDLRAERYRDYGLLKYWFRGIEKFTPWVNKIHFITCGQKPDWLNVSSSKLNWVKHSDYIPSEYLPVFSSHPIELFINKIPGLAEKFVYFNDDIFLTSPLKESYFFKNNLPCDSASFTVLGLGKGRTRTPHIQLNNMIEINKNFTKSQVIKNAPLKWFNPLIGKDFIKNIAYTPYNTIASISIRHSAHSFLKSTFDDVWNNCQEALERTANHKFRNELEDVNQWLFRYWQLCKGNFTPVNHRKNEPMIKISEWTFKDTNAIINQKYSEICIDDDTDEISGIDYDKKMSEITKAFEKILPEKSTFEL
ncbi:MAG: Stealth CR1 domain-containing protein [Treponema sp.]|nr:Stealth CR1 domain-containing protein [Treponema sp.]